MTITSGTKKIPATMVELLRDRATQQNQQHAYTFLVDGKKPTPPLSYGELDQQARAIAAWLQQHQAKKARVLLLYPQGLEVIAAFCGCLYAGAIAIPTPPPESGRIKRTLPRLRSIVQDAEATFVLTTKAILELISNVRGEFPEFEQMQWLDTEEVNLSLADAWRQPEITSESLAYLQYTSGSTSTPKGVMLTHHNLMHHCACLQEACGYTPESVTTTWMPYFHDYGLVEGMMVPLYNGTPCYLMSPFAFIKRPIQWLKNITQYQVTHSQAPNFAYDMCVRRVKAKDIPLLDLSSWEAAGNAAEPINPKVMAEFVETFQPCGFTWSSFAPAYGLAEFTLLVSSKPKGTQPVFLDVDARALEQGKVVMATEAENSRTLPSCGELVGDTQVAIVNPETLNTCAPQEVGEIWVTSASVTKGYWQRDIETSTTFAAYTQDTQSGPFLRTGDLGFYHQGQLYITGRLKDVIIMRGANYYPQDLEWTVQNVHPALRNDYGAVFSLTEQENERLVIIQEIERGNQDLDLDELMADIRQAIAEEHEVATYAIVLAKPGNILKTASGKIQRRAIKSKFLAGDVTSLATWYDTKD